MANSSVLLAKRIRERLAKLSLTQGELSERSGLGQVQISKYLNLKSEPTLGSIDRIAEALGVTPDWLIREDAPEPTHTVEDCLAVVSRAARSGCDLPEMPPKLPEGCPEAVADAIAAALVRRLSADPK